jgi:hypothetical protein
VTTPAYYQEKAARYKMNIVEAQTEVQTASYKMNIVEVQTSREL